MVSRKVLVATLIAFALSGSALAQDLSKLVTKAEVEKVTGAKFKDGWKPMEGQIMFQQDGGDLQISVEVEKRDAGLSAQRVWQDLVDLGKLSADFEKPRVQMSVAVAGAKTPAQAKQIVTDLAKVVGPRVGK